MVSASLMCAFSSFYSPELSRPTPPQYYAKLPQQVTVTQAKADVAQALEGGVFGKLPATAATMVLNTKRPAVELAMATKKGGEAGFLAMIEALRLSGFAIAEKETILKAEATRDQGVTLPYWYLQILSRGENFEAKLSLKDFITGLSQAVNVPAADLEKAFTDDLRDLSSSPNEGVKFFGEYVNALNMTTSEEVQLGQLQLALLWMRLEAELALRSSPNKRMKMVEGCDAAATTSINNAEIAGKGKSFQRTIKITEANNSDSPANAKRSLDRLVNFVKTHSAIMKAFSAAYKFTLAGGAPLVRTKNKTAGEKKALELQFVPRVKESDELRCFSAIAYSAGVKLNRDLGADFMKDNKITFHIEKAYEKKRIGFDYGNNNYTNTFSATVNDKGIVKAQLIGLPQDKVLPANAKPIMLKVPVKFETELSVLDYVSPVPGRDAEVVVDALLAMEKLQGKNKIKSDTIIIPVKDWVESAEGTITVAVMGQNSISSTTGDSSRTVETDWSGYIRSKIDYFITSKSVLNPGWPTGVPMPPGMPPELKNPSLTIMDDGVGAALAGMRYRSAERGVCDICRPEDGNYDFSREEKNKLVSTGAPVASGSTFMGPMQIDRKNKKLTAKLMVSTLRANMNWSIKYDGGRCKDAEAPQNENGFKEFVSMPVQFFELEIPYEEVDGVATITKSYEVFFDYRLNHQDQVEYSIPASLNLTFDLRIPLP